MSRSRNRISMIILAGILLFSFASQSCKENNVEANREEYENSRTGNSGSGAPVISNPSPYNGASVSVSSSTSGYQLSVDVYNATSCTIHYDDDNTRIDYSVTGTVSSGSCYSYISFTSGRFKNNGTNYWYVEATNSGGTTRYPSSSDLSFSISTY